MQKVKVHRDGQWTVCSWATGGGMKAPRASAPCKSSIFSAEFVLSLYLPQENQLRPFCLCGFWTISCSRVSWKYPNVHLIFFSDLFLSSWSNVVHPCVPLQGVLAKICIIRWKEAVIDPSIFGVVRFLMHFTSLPLQRTNVKQIQTTLLKKKRQFSGGEKED